jgi:hypothetical protein
MLKATVGVAVLLLLFKTLLATEGLLKLAPNLEEVEMNGSFFQVCGLPQAALKVIHQQTCICDAQITALNGILRSLPEPFKKEFWIVLHHL